jgi:hypothetical protein
MCITTPETISFIGSQDTEQQPNVLTSCPHSLPLLHIGYFET